MKDRVMKGDESSPHRSQRPIFIPNYLEAGTSLRLRIIRHESTERKFQFCHIAGELQFTALFQWLDDRDVQDECLHDVFYDRDCPVHVNYSG